MPLYAAPPPVRAGTAVHGFTIPKPSRRPLGTAEPPRHPSAALPSALRTAGTFCRPARSMRHPRLYRPQTQPPGRLPRPTNPSWPERPSTTFPPKPSRRPNQTALKPSRVVESIRGSIYGLVTVTFQYVNRGREMWSRLGFPNRVLPYAICPIMECFRGKWQFILVAYKDRKTV